MQFMFLLPKCLRACALLGVVFFLAACTPDCSGLVGMWRTDYNGEALSFEIRADQSLTTVASGEITGGSWQCLATGSAQLNDKKTAPVKVVLVDADTLKMPVSTATPGLPEITLKRVAQP
jgi:hypothetical protein